MFASLAVNSSCVLTLSILNSEMVVFGKTLRVEVFFGTGVSRGVASLAESGISIQLPHEFVLAT